MKSELLDVTLLVKMNGLESTASPVMFDKGAIPTSDGLFSTQIYGLTAYDRKFTWSYIDLKRKFITPKSYITLTRLFRNIESLVYGSKKFIIKDGELYEDEKGETGLDFLYKNWEKIKFNKNKSSMRNDRIDALEYHKKEEIFIDKFPIIPAFFRDVHSQENNPRIPEINDLYSKIIRNVNSLETSVNFDFMNLVLEGKTQQLIVDVYNLLKDKIDGKEGYIKKHLASKSVDYCSRLVLTGTEYTFSCEKDEKINFLYTGVPVAHCCSIFTPFIIWWLKRYFKNEYENTKDSYPVRTPVGKNDSKVTYVKLESPEVYFNDEYIYDRLEKYIYVPSTRFDVIEVPVKQEYLDKLKLKQVRSSLVGYTGKLTTMGKNENKITRNMTWTDLLYMACVDVLSDKHCYVTRYPMLDFNGTYCSRIHIMSTRITQPMVINNKLYENYPVIDLSLKKKEIEVQFKETIGICPLYLNGLDGDHDGDQVTVKSVFSIEANEEAEAILFSKLNLLSLDGSNIRTIGNEGIQTLYTMTRFRDK